MTSFLRSSMRCAMRSRGGVRCPTELSCSAGRSLLGRVVSLCEYTRCSGRAEMRRPDLLPGTGALFVPERRPGAAPSPGATLTGRRSPGPTAPEATSAPVRCTGGELPAACAPRPLPRAGTPRRTAVRTGPVGHGPDAPPSTGASPRTAAPPARTDRGRSVPCPRNAREARCRTQVTLPQEPGNDRRPFSSARPHRVLRTLTSSSGRRNSPGHGLPWRLAAVTITEGNLFPAPARHNTPLVPRHRRERGPFLREARSRSRGVSASRRSYFYHTRILSSNPSGKPDEGAWHGRTQWRYSGVERAGCRTRRPELSQC